MAVLKFWHPTFGDVVVEYTIKRYPTANPEVLGDKYLDFGPVWTNGVAHDVSGNCDLVDLDAFPTMSAPNRKALEEEVLAYLSYATGL